VLQLLVTDSSGLSSVPATVTVSTINTPPVADAGLDQAITSIGTVVQLNGSKSFDPDAQFITYHWTMLVHPPGSHATLSDPTSAAPTFVADVHGDYGIQLIVTDSLGASSTPATVKVSFNNVAPVADAGTSASAIVGQTVTLDGRGSTDANGDPLVYKWTVVAAPKKSTAAVNNLGAQMASLTIDQPGTFVLQLIVNDGLVDSLPATVQIEAVNQKTQLTEDIRRLQQVIAKLSPHSFKNFRIRVEFVIKLNAVIAELRHQNYKIALEQLKSILNKTNGCATRGAPDKKDWIISCPAQSTVYTPLIHIIAEVKTLCLTKHPTNSTMSPEMPTDDD
jgi:PKD domain